MEERTLRVLEFTKIRAMLGQLTVSELGAERCAALVPADTLEEAQRRQEETEEACALLAYLPQYPLIGFGDIRSWLKLAGIGAALSPKALLEIAGSLRAAAAARKALVTDRENTPHITAEASRLEPLRRLQEAIEEAILSEEEIADRASPQLADIRRRIRACNDRIRDRLNAMIHSPQTAKHLQEPIVTMRGDRYVLPVKAESRSAVPGLIHDQSATGATLFVEPMAVVEIGNDLRQLHAAEKTEIERILRELSAQAAAEADTLETNLQILTVLDDLFARARLSRQMRGVQPRLNDRGVIRLIRARHPLIDPEKVVPSTLSMGETFTALVITGPNTGGKTVTLKTVGLLTLMAQAGLQIPADLGSELCVFDQVFADIGDEQSIEQSLSTFSSHMTNIVDILAKVTPRSLALFDELGAGTDPTEGAALAQAVIARLLSMGTRTLATTHYSELKAFALTTPGVENASVEFDVETLRPTYRLSVGIPGKSNAFEISRRLGLDESVIEEARKLLTRDQVRFEDVIANAEMHRQIAERERALAEEARQEMNRARREAEEEQERLREQREAQLRKAREEARRIVEQAKAQSESVIAELRRMKKDGDTREHGIVQARKELEDASDALRGHENAVPAGEPPKDLRAGEAVIITDTKTRGTVLTPPDARGEVTVQAGIMKLKVPLSRLRRDRTESKPQTSLRTTVDVGTRQASMECDVRGMNLEEAIGACDKFLDDASLTGLGEVVIIHGKGSGVLRAGIGNYLRRHSRVKSFRLGRYGEGEDGVTVVTLK